MKVVYKRVDLDLCWMNLGESSIWKWWFLRDKVTEIYSSDASDLIRAKFDLPRPSVRYLKTVNAKDIHGDGEEMAVNAQQYCVLLTNFPDINSVDSG